MPSTRLWDSARRSDPGAFRHLITIWDAGTPTRDDGGGQIPGTPQEVGDVWALIETWAASRDMVADQLQARSTHRVTCREWVEGVEAGMTIQTDDGRRFTITAPPIDEVGTRRTMSLLAREGPPETVVS